MERLITKNFNHAHSFLEYTPLVLWAQWLVILAMVLVDSLSKCLPLSPVALNRAYQFQHLPDLALGFSKRIAFVIHHNQRKTSCLCQQSFHRSLPCWLRGFMTHYLYRMASKSKILLVFKHGIWTFSNSYPNFNLHFNFLNVTVSSLIALKSTGPEHGMNTKPAIKMESLWSRYNLWFGF